mmetsp:Transcript_86002/g.230035  ORF Transcript_86002/g.230035 Transcript_86002/m.230035 type:complete len:90 (-) Transcript_86002:73-342(-)
MFRIARVARMRVPAVEFTKGRFARRFNLQDEDRAKMYNWNLACVVATALPLVYMYMVNYETCWETSKTMKTLDPMHKQSIRYDMRLFVQ